ncbi:uncharacterized protein LOC142505026 [Primulina tabacum]|uniref:uncharacterized protein LOC142505026 n=1 Tax=Primulina tabacum TaxID=48773 RepID=UPI003F592B94
MDVQFDKFLEVFKKLHINIPFTDALMKMSSHAKFLKDILANKRKLEDHMTINLTENYSALVQNKIPPKLKDPGNFVVLNMEEDMEMSSIMGRPFLATGKALIDVQEGKLRLRVGKKQITFDVFNDLKHTLRTDDCFRIDALDSLVNYFAQDAVKDPLEATLTAELKEDDLCNVTKI